MDDIIKARDAFVAADTAFTTAYAEYKNRELDVALAQREGEDVAGASARLDEQRSKTFGLTGAFQARKDALLALCAALDITTDALKNAL